MSKLNFLSKLGIISITSIISIIGVQDKSLAIGFLSRVLEFTNGNIEAEELHINLEEPIGKDTYSWLKVIDSIGLVTDVTIPDSVRTNGGKFNFEPTAIILPDEKLKVIVSHTRKSGRKKNATELSFTDIVTGTKIFDDEPVLLTAVENRGPHNDLNDGFGGTSEYAMVWSNDSLETINVTDFVLYENIDMDLFAAELESDNIDDNLYRDPISTIGSGNIVENIMPNFSLLPGEELAFHFSENFDQNLLVVASGFCGSEEEEECATSDMVLVPEPNTILGLLAISGLGLSIKRKKYS